MRVIDSTVYRESVKQVAEKLANQKASVLVTGATGLIGSCMIDILICANEHYGSEFQIYPLGRNRAKMEQRFGYVKQPQMIHYLEQDVCAALDESVQVDYIIHGASNADPKTYAKAPAQTLLTNVMGTRSVLEYCRVHPQTRVLLMSTFEVYGNCGDVQEYTEEMSGQVDVNAVRSCYPESKRCAEILLRCYHQQYQVNGVIARLCSVYGPTMFAEDSKAHAQFIRNGLQNQNIVLKSEGKQKRTYAYVMDVADALFLLLMQGQAGQAYNVSNECSVATIAQVAQTVADICGTKVVYDLPDELEKRGFSKPQDCVLANEKLRLLGWTGRYSLQEGLCETIQILSEITE